MLVCMAYVELVLSALVFPNELVALLVQRLFGCFGPFSNNIPKKLRLTSVEVDLQPSGSRSCIKRGD